METVKEQDIKISKTKIETKKPSIKNGIWLATYKEETDGMNWFKHTGPSKINATYVTLLAVQAYTMVNNKLPAFLCHYSLATSINDLTGFHEATKVIQADMNHTLLGYDEYETPEDNIEGVLGNDRSIVISTMDYVPTPSTDGTYGNISGDAFDTTSYAIAKMCKEMKVNFKCYKYLTKVQRYKDDMDDWLAECQKGAKLLKQMCDERFGDIPSPAGEKNE